MGPSRNFCGFSSPRDGWFCYGTSAAWIRLSLPVITNKYCLSTERTTKKFDMMKKKKELRMSFLGVRGNIKYFPGGKSSTMRARKDACCLLRMCHKRTMHDTARCWLI